LYIENDDCLFIHLFDSYYHYHAFGEIKIYIYKGRQLWKEKWSAPPAGKIPWPMIQILTRADQRPFFPRIVCDWNCLLPSLHFKSSVSSFTDALSNVGHRSLSRSLN